MKRCPSRSGTGVFPSWVMAAAVPTANTSPSGWPVEPGGKARDEVKLMRSLASMAPELLMSAPTTLVRVQAQVLVPAQLDVTAYRPPESATPKTPSDDCEADTERTKDGMQFTPTVPPLLTSVTEATTDCQLPVTGEPEMRN